ncbi:MAG: preprotein translocase subunit YajC [Coriobacteriia bacterium]|nr:preprotein translocase subunit YajC [Coriobacteriia bacterium]
MNQNVVLAVGYAAVVFGAMYFLWIMPQQKQRKAQAEMLAALLPGDEVITAGGIYGRVVSLTDDDVKLEIATGVAIRVARGAIVGRTGEERASDE